MFVDEGGNPVPLLDYRFHEDPMADDERIDEAIKRQRRLNLSISVNGELPTPKQHAVVLQVLNSTIVKATIAAAIAEVRD